jgi:glycerophosphoryl diester phosphodiesterase
MRAANAGFTRRRAGADRARRYRPIVHRPARLAVVLAAACSTPGAPAGPGPDPVTITRPRIVAHRGASLDAPENTLAAFRRAWEQGVECVELDVRLTRDGGVVVIHDATTARTAGVDRPVVEQTLAEVRALDAGSWRGERFAGEKIPTLAEVIATIPRGGTLFVELKTGPGDAKAVADVIREANASARGASIALQAYDAEALAALAAAVGGNVPTFWDVDPPAGPDRMPAPYTVAPIDTALARGFTGLALDHRFVTDDFLAAAHTAGLAMDVWTVNDAADLAAWSARDVRWLETDRPDLAPSAK